MSTEDNKFYKYNSRLRFYGGSKHAFININPDFIEKLGLTESDDISQELTNDGRIAIGKRKEN